MLASSNVASDVVFTSKKSGVLVDDALHYHRMVGCVFPLFLWFSFFTFSTAANVVEFFVLRWFF